MAVSGAVANFPQCPAAPAILLHSSGNAHRAFSWRGGTSYHPFKIAKFTQCSFQISDENRFPATALQLNKKEAATVMKLDSDGSESCSCYPSCCQK